MSSTDEIPSKAVPVPPPLPLKVDSKEKLSIKSNDVSSFQPNSDNLWGSKYPELQRACFFAQVSLDDPPLICKFREFPGIIQEGPTCGLVALSMLFNNQIQAQALLEQAKSNNFTNNGEMFSAANLHTLLRLNINHLTNHENAETYLYTGLLDSDKIKTELECGSILLVPYDADVTHAPAELNGHKAHWALIIGYLRNSKALLEQAKSNNFTNNGEMFSAANLHTLLRLNINHLTNHENAETYLYTGLLDSDKIKTELDCGSILLVPYDADVTHAPAMLNGHKAHWALIIGYLRNSKGDFYVIARHGKSKFMALWSLKALSDSNKGLMEFAQPKQHENAIFLLPDGGIAGENGLCQKCIVIKYVGNEQIVL
uniref:Actin maturation protease n=1 Tax=Culicoides sonorensis TaxID=179676 RepID=A0A336LBH6_CULSO